MVCLSLKNPLLVVLEEDEDDTDPNDYIVNNRSELLHEATVFGHDGIAVTGEGETIYIAFEPEQIRFAFDRDNCFNNTLSLPIASPPVEIDLTRSKRRSPRM